MESRLAIVEKQYLDALEFFSNMTHSSLGFHTRDYENEAIKAALSFQRSIELLFEDVRKLGDNSTQRYIDRCQDKTGSIDLNIRGGSHFTGACSRVDKKEFDDAYYLLIRARSDMYQVLEDVRLIYSLRLYPIEEKMALKSILTDYGFTEITKCLEEAERNLAETEHNKECVDRCREALEKTPSSMLAYIDKKPSFYFATDLGTLAGLGVLDKESKKLTEATYSYLSEVGPHGRAGEVSPQDAHWSMKEVYIRIDVLLNKFTTYLKEEKKAKSKDVQ